MKKKRRNLLALLGQEKRTVPPSFHPRTLLGRGGKKQTTPFEERKRGEAPHFKKKKKFLVKGGIVPTL